MENINNGQKYGTQKLLPWIDFFKFIFCVCIVLLHSDLLSIFPEAVGYYGTCVFRLAVPYFFVASGFFLGRKLIGKDWALQSDLVRHYITRLLKPFLVFSVVWISQRTISLIMIQTPLMQIFLKLAHNVIMYPLNALWYVQASIIAALLILPFVRNRRGIYFAVAIGVVLYIWALICNNYYFIVQNTPIQTAVDIYMKIFISARNGIFVGFLFISCGILCAQVEEQIDSHGIIFLRSLLLISSLLYIYEASSIREHIPADDGAVFLSHIVLLPTMVLLLACKKGGLVGISTVWMRNLSVGIYFLHKPILWFFSFSTVSPFVKFIVTFTCSIAICLISYHSKSRSFKQLLK